MVNREKAIVQINVDVQNDFCPGGALAVTSGDEVVKPLNDLAKEVRDANGLVVVTQDFHPVETAHFDQWPVHCVGGTNGAEFHPNLDIKAEDIVVKKGTLADEDAYSGFDGRDETDRTLEEVIVELGAKETKLLIGGLATDYCVKATILDALKIKNAPKLAVYALTDAMRAVNLQPEDGENALAEIEAAGAVLATTTELIDLIQKGEL